MLYYQLYHDYSLSFLASIVMFICKMSCKNRWSILVLLIVMMHKISPQVLDHIDQGKALCDLFVDISWKTLFASLHLLERHWAVVNLLQSVCGLSSIVAGFVSVWSYHCVVKCLPSKVVSDFNNFSIFFGWIVLTCDATSALSYTEVYGSGAGG